MSAARPDAAAELRKLAHQLGVPSVASSTFLGRVARRRSARAAQPDRRGAVPGRQAPLQQGWLRWPRPCPSRWRQDHRTRAAAAARRADLRAARAEEGRRDGAAAADGYLADVSAAMDPAARPRSSPRCRPRRVAARGRRTGRARRVGGDGRRSCRSCRLSRAARRGARLDGEQLLRIGFVLDDLGRLGEIATMLSDRAARRDAAAAVDHDAVARARRPAAELDARAGRAAGRALRRGADDAGTAIDAAARPTAVTDTLAKLGG